MLASILDPEAVSDGIVKNYSLVTDPQEVPDIAGIISRNPIFALDLETTGLDFNRSSIHGIALAVEDQEWYICRGAEKAMLPYLPDLMRGKPVVMHNGLFDCHFLGRYSIRPDTLIDTMVGQFLVDENQSVGLKSLAGPKLGIRQELPDFAELLHLAKRLTGRKRLDEVTIYDVPLHKLAIYAARDARLTFDLWKKTAYELDREGMTNQFYNVEMPFIQVLIDMEEAGFYIDQRLLNQLGIDFEAKKKATYDLWIQISGGVNPNSPLQLGEYFYKKMGYKATKETKTGAPSTDIIALTRLLQEDKNGAVKALLEFRKYDKLIGTYVETFREQIYNSRLYGNFNQTGTVTGRLSSSGPNLQNIPGNGEAGSQVRAMFSVPPGFTFLDIDYSQIELRLVAHYTKDENLMRVFETGGDPHQMTANLINNLGFAISRKQAKSVNFGWAYGMGPRGLQDSVEKSSGSRPGEKDCKAWLDGFSKAYPGAARWKWRVIEYAHELGYVKTIAGRKRRLPEITSPDRSLAGQAERQAVNSIIQGSAGDIIKWSMLQIYPLLKQYGVKLTAQVHDELTFECPDNSVDEFGEKAAVIMRSAGEFFKLRVKLEAEPGKGKNWAETH